MKASPDIEERLRAHLADERQAIRPPQDLEARLLQYLEASAPSREGLGVGRQLLLAAALVLFTAGLAFGFARLREITRGPIGPSPTPSVSISVSPSASATSSATPIASPRAATATEYNDMVAAGKPGAERKFNIPDCGSSSPHVGNDCFEALGPQDSWVGTNAGYFHGARGGSGCWVYLYQDAGGWHFVDAQCAQAVGSLPRLDSDDTVNVTGCANVRSQPGLQSPVVACLPNGTNVHISGGLVYQDSKLWWFLQGRGWMVHDSLVGAP